MENLEKKPWFRLLKVFYIFSYFIAAIILIAVAYTARPQNNLDESNSLINCSNGKSYHIGITNGVLLDSNGALFKSDEEQARKLCAYGDPYSTEVTPAESNYHVNIAWNPTGSWKEAIEILVFGYVGMFIFFEIIKRTFLYVAVGENFFN